VDLARLVVAEGLAAPEAVTRALAGRGDRTLAEALVDAGVAEDALADALARAVGVAVVDLASGALDPDVVTLVPADVAWRHLAVAVAPEPGRDALQVVFADPLDEGAVQAVRDATGLEVTLLVGTVSGVRGTLARTLGARVPGAPGAPASGAATPVPSPFVAERAAGAVPAAADPAADPAALDPATADVPAEHTQRLAAATPLAREPTLTTAPSHRIADEASLEQRLEALVLTLVEAGVISRADYAEALRRLLRR
jgi:hypothetical protein